MAQQQRTRQQAAQRQQRARKQPVAAAAPEGMAVRWLLAALVVLGTIAFLTNVNEPFQIPKQLVLALGALALLGAAAWDVSARGALVVPTGWAVRLGVAVVAMMAVATFLNDYVLRSVFGEYGRSAGLLSYVAVLVLFLAVLRAHRPSTLSGLAWAFIAAAVPMTAYGLLQQLGFEPLGLNQDVEKVVSTLGQQNFVGGYVAILVPFTLWAALDRRRAIGPRIALGILALTTAFVGVASRSFQVLPALVAGAALVVGFELLGRLPRRRVLQGAGAVLLVGVLGAAAFGSRIDHQVRAGLDERVLMWQAGGRMVSDDPVTGHGPAGYASEFSTFRPDAHAVKYGTFQIVDAPHDVPLAMFVSGGVLLGLLYLAFVAWIGWLLVQGLRRTDGEQRRLLAAFGGAWLAYQVQSLVSIDQVTLMIAHFVTAAAVVVLAGGAGERALAIPSLRPRRVGRNAVAVTSAGWAVRAAALVAIAFAAWFVTRPVRADVAYEKALELRASNQLPEAALPEIKRATATGSWVGSYWAQQATLLAGAGDQDGALAAGTQAALQQPSAVSYALSTAQLAHRVGRDDLADRFFRFAVAHGPNDADALQADAEYLRDRGRFDQAIRMARRAVALEPAHDQLQLTLAGIYAQAKRYDEAIALYTKLIALGPNYVEPRQGLAELYDAMGKPELALPVWQDVYRIQPTSPAAIAALHLG